MKIGGQTAVVDSRDVLRRVTGKAWSAWYQHKLPGAELSSLLQEVRDDASHACRHAVSDDYFLDPGRRRRIEDLEQASHRLADHRLRRQVAAVVAGANDTWAKTKSPAVVEQDPRWSAWQFAAARDWLSATKSAIDRIHTLERRRPRVANQSSSSAAR